MPGDTLPAFVAVHVDIRKAYLRHEFALSVDSHSHAADVAGIAIHMGLEFRKLVVDGSMVGSLGQSGGAVGECAVGASGLELIGQDAAECIGVPVLQRSRSRLLDRY